MPTELPTPILAPGESQFQRWETVKGGGALRILLAVELPLLFLELVVPQLSANLGEGRWEKKDVRDNFDALPTSRHIPIDVFLALGVILHSQTPDAHRVWAITIIRLSASPFDGILRIFLVATRPYADADIHWRLRKVLAPVRFSILQHPDTCTIDIPLELILGPTDGVIVEIVLGLEGRWVPDGAIVAGRISFAEVIALDMCSVSAQDLPVNFI